MSGGDVLKPFLEELQRAIARTISRAIGGLRAEDVEVVAAADAAYSGEELMAAAAVAWDLKTRKVIERSYSVCKPPYPYVPGLLFLREGPAVLEAVKGLRCGWDVLLVDGHGLLHPRRTGLAVILGFVLDRPSIGVAKSLLVGVEGEGEEMGPIYLDGERLGYWFRGHRRFYASPGYLVRVDEIPRIMRLLGPGYPEVLKAADRAAREKLREVSGKG